MTSEDERDTADGARPGTSGSAKRVKTAGGTKVEVHDVQTSRILVTTVSLQRLTSSNSKMARSMIFQTLQLHVDLSL